MTFEKLLAGLREHRDVHQQWLTHLEHCESCPDCAVNVVEQVGDVATHRGHLAFYDEAIRFIEQQKQVGGVYFSPEADAQIKRESAAMDGASAPLATPPPATEPPPQLADLLTRLDTATHRTPGNFSRWTLWSPEQIDQCFIDAADALRAALARPPAASAWQPIETAPKDGTAVLVYAPGPGEYVYPPQPGKVFPDVRVSLWWKGDKLNTPRWESMVYSQPTHWMPLPGAPEAP